MGDHKKRLRKQILVSVVFVFSVLMILSIVPGVKLFGQETETQAEGTAASADRISPELATVKKYAFIAAAVAFGLGAIGAGLAIGNVGAAAMGAVAEKPEIAGQALIFVALAEGLVVFGFITALLILGKV
jgi:V/A-type H+-transporting ATPase subunit K